MISSFISDELVTNPELLPLSDDTNLLESGILDSLSLLKLVSFLEEQFKITVKPEELIPQNFQSIGSICVFTDSKKQNA